MCFTLHLLFYGAISKYMRALSRRWRSDMPGCTYVTWKAADLQCKKYNFDLYVDVCV